MGKRQWPLYIMIAVFAVYWVFMAILPTDRMQWLMENVLLVSVVLVLFSPIKISFLSAILFVHLYLLMLSYLRRSLYL